MDFTPLATVRHRLRVGSPVPFNIRNADGTLLLARGKVIDSDDQIEALEDRGAVVEGEEHGAVGLIRNAPVNRLPSMWSVCMGRVHRTLTESVQPNFTAALDEAAKPVLALIERDPDLAIFQMVQQESHGKTSYGVVHSLHTAMASYLVGMRLGWGLEGAQRAFKAALTMNLAMMELQSRLANQVTPLTPAQRDIIREHPNRSVEMLQASGITDEEWLTAVGQHHEAPDGKGYPLGLCQTTELASLLRYIDIYTAKLSRRASREALAANEAARALFMQDQKHPIVSAIVKEFGIYPPGCYVALASGETGVVVKRGPSANTPLVASLTNRNGDALIEPIRRDTSLREHAITGVISEKSIRVRVSTEKLVVLAHS